MAIVGMKKLRVVAARGQRDELIRRLQELGCVELKEQEYLLDDPDVAPLVSCDHGELLDARTRCQIYEDAIKVLTKYAPQKSPLLAPKPELRQEAIFDETGEAELKQVAKELSLLDEKMRNLDSDATRERLLIESMEPWKGCSLPLETEGTRHVGVQFGILPADADMARLSANLSEEIGEVELTEAGADDKARYVIVFYLREKQEDVMRILHEADFAAASFGGAKGTAGECIAQAESYLEEIAKQREDAENRIRSAAKYWDGIKTSYDRAVTALEREQAKELLLKTETAVLLEGWAVAEESETLTALLDGMGCAWELTDPAVEEYPEVPVKLKNNRLTDGLNMVTDMYSLPQYGSVDPNPLMAPFFILFYGIMMADIGYGLLMMLIGALITFKKKPREGFMRYFGELMLEGGFATAIMGVLTGGFFGDAPKWVVQLINPESTWQGLPALIDPLSDTVMILAGALVLGFIHLNAGMVISLVMKIRRGELLDGLCNEVAMWVLFLGAGLTVLGVGGKAGIIVGIVVYVLGKVIPAKGFGRVMAIFSGLYNDLTGWFGDILSYSRLMALMLAGSVIAQVFNNLGAMPGNIVVFFIICILGNLLNFGLNLLGCYVHDLRLQCLEFFNKFYVAGGRAFRPLAVRSKYYNITK